MGEQTTALSTRAPADVERDIESTRRRIEHRAELLRDRLAPKELLRPLTDRLRNTLGEGGSKVLDAFRENPLPLALMGVGLGWLLLKDLRPAASAAPREPGESSGTGAVEKAKELVSGASEKAKGLVSGASESVQQAGEKVSAAAGSVSQKVGDAAQRTKEAVKRSAGKTADWFETTLDRNPLALAIGALAVGAVAGMLLPVSEPEERVMGDLGEKAAEAVLEKGAEAARPEESKPEGSGDQGTVDTATEGGLGT